MGSKGGDSFILPLISSIKVPHENVIRLNIVIYDGNFFMMVTREASEPILVSTAAPFSDL